MIDIECACLVIDSTHGNEFIHWTLEQNAVSKNERIMSNNQHLLDNC